MLPPPAGLQTISINLMRLMEPPSPTAVPLVVPPAMVTEPFRITLPRWMYCPFGISRVRPLKDGWKI